VAPQHSSIRVALIGCTGLLGDVICQTVTTEPDIDVVAELMTPALDLDISAVDADVVLWNDADEPEIAAWLSTSGKQSPRVLATMSDGQQAALWELTPRRIELGALSPQTLVQTIRDSAARRL
jgi:hypothetical protein